MGARIVRHTPPALGLAPVPPARKLSPQARDRGTQGQRRLGRARSPRVDPARYRRPVARRLERERLNHGRIRRVLRDRRSRPPCRRFSSQPRPRPWATMSRLPCTGRFPTPIIQTGIRPRARRMGMGRKRGERSRPSAPRPGRTERRARLPCPGRRRLARQSAR